MIKIAKKNEKIIVFMKFMENEVNQAPGFKVMTKKLPCTPYL